MRFIAKFFSLVSLSILLVISVSCSQNASKESRQMEIKELSKSEINLSGTWISEDNPFYPELEFKGKSTVVVTALSSLFLPVVTSYERDEEVIRVEDDESDLLFEIVSKDTLIGLSLWATGTWVRQ